MRHVDRILARELITYGGPLTVVLLLVGAVIAFDLIAPWPFELIIDKVLATTPTETGGFFNFLDRLFPSRDSLGFFAVFVYFASTSALSLVEYLRSLFIKKVVRNFTADFSRQAFRNLEALSIGFYNKQKIGDYIYRLGYDVTAIGEFLEEGILPIVSSTLYIGVTTTILFLINPQLTLLSLAALPFLAGGMYVFNGRVAKATKRSEFYNSATFSFIEETLNHLKVIQAFSQENKRSLGFDRRLTTSLWSDMRLYRLDFLISLVVGLVIASSYALVMLYGIHAVFSGTLTTGLLVVFIFYLDNLTSPLLSLIYATTAAREAYTKIGRIEELFKAKTHLSYHPVGALTTIAHTDLRFEHVSFEGRDGTNILHNLSFTIEAGKRTVIFGSSGSGKTTIANLIMRFIDKPTHGRVLLGGEPLEHYDVTTLRDAIAYVPQEITLFDDTIRHNVIFGNPHHDHDRMLRAVRVAEAKEFIEKLPGKYDFSVGESGTFLSGGQRQRLMLARALMKEEAPILMFDETFSALDVRTRKTVLRNIVHVSEHKTTIIISNVFDVIAIAENIIVLNHGKLLYSGPSERLPKEISLYRMIDADEPHESGAS